MGKINKGIHGEVKGKVGNLVYTTWKGIPVVKTAPVRTAAPTENEKANRSRFNLSNEWLSPLTPLLRIGFKNYTPTNEGFTAAKSYLHKHALIRDGINASIDPALVKVSYGELPLSDDIQVELNAEKQLVFSWDNSITRDRSALDQVMLLAYDIDKGIPVMDLGRNFRMAGTATLSLEVQQPGDFHIYLAFVAEDRSRQSDSVYLGMVSLT